MIKKFNEILNETKFDTYDKMVFISKKEPKKSKIEKILKQNNISGAVRVENSGLKQYTGEGEDEYLTAIHTKPIEWKILSYIASQIQKQLKIPFIKTYSKPTGYKKVPRILD